MKNKRLFLLFWALLPLLTVSCVDDDDEELIGTWYRMSDFDGLARSYASSFTIGNKGYIVGGYNGKTQRLSDTWEYDMEQDFWTQKASFPGKARQAGTAFAIDEKGYFGTGYDAENYYNDFWEYDPASNTWSEKATYPGSGRYGTVSFSIAGKGYIGCGYDGNYLKDFYAYNPSANSWEQIISIGGSKRVGATAFVIGDKAYVCCGENNGDYPDDFWTYDPSTATWTQLRDISNSNSDEDYDDDYTIVRRNAAAFVIDGCAYLTCGEQSGVRTDTWKYYPSTDLWEEVRKFKGSARSNAVTFSNGSRGFIATGGTQTLHFDDIWELHPYEYDDDEY
ncbi:Kelch repeat-containing protein [Parabacteroides pacaensis]|uniref:Kelch repeat-containing protein n=1 Tax=Parabacteroides pacaensis TaxID=2086575 RepID=UPI000D0FC59A|nr:kelch repeat-containing protein [Parabacteroides pacaensis]